MSGGNVDARMRFFRSEAQRCKRLAAENTDPEIVRHLLRLAAEFEDRIDDGRGSGGQAVR